MKKAKFIYYMIKLICTSTAGPPEVIYPEISSNAGTCPFPDRGRAEADG